VNTKRDFMLQKASLVRPARHCRREAVLMIIGREEWLRYCGIQQGHGQGAVGKLQMMKPAMLRRERRRFKTGGTPLFLTRSSSLRADPISGHIFNFVFHLNRRSIVRSRRLRLSLSTIGWFFPPVMIQAQFLLKVKADMIGVEKLWGRPGHLSTITPRAFITMAFFSDCMDARSVWKTPPWRCVDLKQDRCVGRRI